MSDDTDEPALLTEIERRIRRRSADLLKELQQDSRDTRGPSWTPPNHLKPEVKGR